jgi:peptidoglycan/LPS O-acetylase OafA/YrhL
MSHHSRQRDEPISEQDRPTSTPIWSAGSERFVFLDGLRGIACLAVVLFHFQYFGVLNAYPQRFEPWVIEKFVLPYGYLGVQVFFVISGFVMLHSQGRTEPGLRPFAGFLLRRSFRLDPSYWLALAVMVAIEFHLGHPHDGRDVLLNALYLQDIAGHGSILPPAWTLCYEMQFYLVLILIVMAARAVGRRLRRDSDSIVLWFSLPLAIASIVVYLAREVKQTGVFLDMWFMFYLGMLAYGTVRKMHARLFYLVIAALLGVGITLCHDARQEQLIAAVATSVLIVIAGKVGALSRWLRSSIIQFMGRISYSAYLIHWPVAVSVRTLPPAPRLLIACATTIGLSWACRQFVEEPGISLGKRLAAAVIQKEQTSGPIPAPMAS